MSAIETGEDETTIGSGFSTMKDAFDRAFLVLSKIELHQQNADDEEFTEEDISKDDI